MLTLVHKINDSLILALKLLGLKEDDFEDVTKELISCPIVLRGKNFSKLSIGYSTLIIKV